MFEVRAVVVHIDNSFLLAQGIVRQTIVNI